MKPLLFSGISMPCHKSPAILRPVETLPPAKTLLVPLGTSSDEVSLLVHFSSHVAQFDCLGKNKQTGFPVFSPVSGTVTGLIPAESGFAALIAPDPVQSTPPVRPISTENLTAQQLIDLAFDAGLVDEYDNIPLYEKLQTAAHRKVKYLLADAIDEDPYLSAGVRTLCDFGQAVTNALSLCQKALGIPETKIALCDRFLLSKEIASPFQGFEVMRLWGKYPLKQTLIKKYDKKGGVCLLGVNALKGLWDYIATGAPQHKTVITVSGDCIANPVNLSVLIGTPVSHILHHAGLFKEPTHIVTGGVIRPRPVKAADQTPITASSRGVTALLKASVHKEVPCSGCGSCVSVCHKKLMPYYIMLSCRQGDFEQAARYSPELCDDCKACTLHCPASIDVASYVAQCKSSR